MYCVTFHCCTISWAAYRSTGLVFISMGPFHQAYRFIIWFCVLHSCFRFYRGGVGFVWLRSEPDLATNYLPSMLWHCWLGHLTCKNCLWMTYNVSSRTLNLDPRAVAVSCYGWLKTSYGWLAAAYGLRLRLTAKIGWHQPIIEGHGLNIS